LAAGAVIGRAGAARAATVRVSVTLPAEAPDGRESQWRAENGILPIGPRVPDPRTEVVVVLEPKGGRAEKDAKKEAAPLPSTMELHGLRLDPRVCVAAVGATIEFKNSDRVPHTLYVERATTLMPPLPTPSGQSRRQKFDVAGEYRVRDEEFPHLQGTVVVVASPYFGRLDDKGASHLEVPAGRYTLRVFYKGAWVTQSIEAGPKNTDVAIQVPPPTASAPAAGQKR
jgi:hypothetical protein